VGGLFTLSCKFLGGNYLCSTFYTTPKIWELTRSLHSDFVTDIEEIVSK
jgi:hypothetical protein